MPHDYIKSPELEEYDERNSNTQDFIVSNLDEFNIRTQKNQKSAEARLDTVSYQWTKEYKSPYYNL